MSEFIPTLTKALTDQVASLRRIRKTDEFEAWGVMRATAGENAELSRGNPDAVSYWRTVAEIADRHLVSASDPRWKA